MKKVIAYGLFILTIFVSFSFVTNIVAKDNVVLDVSEKEVKFGDEIIVSIDVNSEHTDLYAYTAKLTYDKDVFEVINTDDFEEQDNWSDISYNKANNKFALINKEGVNSENLVQVKLKVRSDAKPGKTEISVNNVTASDGKKDIAIESSSAEVLVLKDGLDEGESLPSNKVDVAQEEDTQVKVEREASTLGIILIVLILVIVCSLILYYIKISKNDSNNKKLIITAIHIILIIALLIFTIKAFSTKNPDVNNDDNVDYDDAKDIMEYVLEIEKTQNKNDEEAKDKDLNNDGKITITDVAKATQEATNQQYTGSISDPSDNNPQVPENPDEPVKPEEPNYSSSVGKSNVSNLTPSKNEEITLELNIDVTPYTDVKSIIIDGQEYPVEKGEGNNYSVKVPAPQKAGLQDIVISGVVLDNGKSVETEYKVTVDVLKDVPTVNDFVLDTKKSVPQVTVNISDNDGAIKSSKVVITDEQGNIVAEFGDLIPNQDNIFDLNNLEKDKKYNVKVEVTYDLDSDTVGKTEENRHTDVVVNQDFTIEADYGFESQELKITEKVTQRDALILSFKNGYDSYYDVEYVVIDSKKYSVTKNGDVYEVLLEKGQKGSNTVSVEEVILKNGASYKVEEQLEYIYLKDEPNIGQVDVELNDSKLKVTLSSEDNDETITGVTVYLTDNEGNVIETKTLEKGQTEVVFDINKSGDYKVKAEVTYDLGDGETITKEVEYTQEIKEQVKVKILNSSLASNYVQKGQNVEVTYEVETNTQDNIASFVVNGVTLNATKNENGTYTINFTTPQTAGEAELNITKVIFENEGEVETSYNSGYEVLKSTKPVVDGVSIVEQKGDKATLAFTVNDEENTFVSGRIVVTNKESGQEKVITFTNVNDTVHEIDVKDFTQYSVDIYLTYDYDSNKENTDNQQEELFAQKDFELLGDFEFTFNGLRFRDIDKEKNVVVLEFNASLAEEAKNYYIKDVMINGNSYTVTRVGTYYTVEVPYTNNDRQELVLQEAILNNLQGFAVNENNSVVVFKQAPTAVVRNTVTREVTDCLKEITASALITDKDDTIVEGTLHAKLISPNGELLVDNLLLNLVPTENEKEYTSQIEFTSENDYGYDAGTYTVEVYTDYDAVDGEEHIEEKLGEAKVSVSAYANIDSASVVSNKYYVQKGEEIQVTYEISSNTQEEVSAIVVNGQNLPATRNEDGTYTVTLKVPEKYGEYTIEATRLVYEESQQQTAVSNTLKVDVLRSVIPSISNIVVNDDNPDEPILSFSILDEEDTFVSGKVTITNVENGQVQVLDVTSKENISFVLENINEFEEYYAEIEITYDLDSDKTDSQNQGVVKEESKFEVIGEYEFNLQNFKLVEVNTDRKVIVLSFESNNVSNYDIQKVYVSENEYNILSNENGIYTVEIPYSEDTRKVLSLDKVILENLKEFTDLKQENIVVFKNAPTANINVITVSEEMNSIKASFDYIDSDDVIERLYARLKDEQGNVIETKEIEEYAKEVEFVSENGAFKAQEYTVEILADYNRVDGLVHENETLDSENAKVKILANVVSANVENYYVEKESIVKITYEIMSNTDKDVEEFNINGVITNPTKVAQNKYEVIVNTPLDAGQYEYNLTEIIYSQEEKINVLNTTKVDVLKDIVPQVSAVAVDSTSGKPVLTFMLADEEDTFVSGRIVVTQKEDNTSYEIPFNSLDSLSFELENIEQFTKYEVAIYVTYDLDSNKADTKNQQEVLLANKDFEVIGDYEFTFSDFKVKEVDTQRERVILQFVSTNASEDNDEFEDYYVDTVVINGVVYEDVKKEGTTYTVEVPYSNITRTELVLEKAILNNLQEFQISENNSVIVFKSVSGIVIPTVANDLKSIKAEVTLNDIDKIAKNVYIKLLDSQGIEIGRKPIETENEVVTFDNNDNYYKAGEYTIELVASFDAVDGLVHENETIVTTKVEVMTGAMVVSSNSEKYANKGEAYPVTYTIRTNTDEPVDTIVVNQVAYNAQKVSDGVYSVNVIVSDKAGDYNLDVTRINFANEKWANVEYTSKVEILKSIIPTISNLAVGGNEDNPVLSFTINDEENTFVSGKYVIVDKETNEREEYVFTTKENTSFLLQNIKKFNKYDVEVYITYDLDSDMSQGSENQTEILVESNQFEIIGEYNFTLDNLRVEEVNRENNTVTLAFESTNASEDNDEFTDYYVKQVEINGVTYDNITKKGTTYTLVIPYTSEDRTVLTLTRAVLDNLKEFTGLTNSVVIFKDKPTIQLNASIDDNQETITADISLIDEDDTLQTLTARLVNPKGEIISSKEIDNDEDTVSFKSLEGGIFKAGEYTIELCATYDIEDGLVHDEKEVIGSATVKVLTKASITNAQVVNYYVEKGENVQINYTFTSNNEIDPTGVMIGNALYSISKNDDGTYTAQIPATTSGYGVNNHEVSVVVYNGETVVLSEPVKAEYYVLKTAPTVQGYTYNNLTKESNITFEFVDEDETLLSDANIVIVDETGSQVITQKIQVGSVNVVNLSSLSNGKYTVRLEGSYDLDDSVDNNINNYDLSKIFEEQEIEVITDYEAQVKLDSVVVDKENGQIVVTFESENIANFATKSVIIDETEYEVSQENGKYVVKIPYKNGENKVYTFNKVKVENDIELELKEKVSFEVFKKAPTAQIDANLSENNKVINATFTIENRENITALEARLLDKDNVVLKTIQLENNAETVEFVCDGDNEYKAGQYKIEIGANYEILDGQVHNTKESIGSSEIQINIRATIISSDVEKYVQRDAEFKVTYTISANTDEEPTSIVVNDNETISMTKVGENEYEITYKAPNEKGNFVLSAKSLNYSENVTVQNETTVYVLKQIPSITNYTLNNEYPNISVTFDFTDEDETMVDKPKVIVVDEDTGTTVIEQEVNAGTNTLELKNIENDTYTLKFIGKYDLDDEHENSLNEYNLEDLFEHRKIEYIGDYKLQFRLTDTQVNRDSNEIKISFESSNAGNYPIKYVYIGEDIYPVYNENGVNYILVGYETEENRQLDITSVALENGVNLEVSGASTQVFKAKPEITDLDATVKDSTIKVTFNVTDNANIPQNGKVVLMDANGEEVQSKEISAEDTSVEFTDVTDAGTYIVKVVADYDRVDGLTHVQETLGQITIKTKINASVVNEIAPTYAEKLEEISITFEINSNTVEKVKEITVNGNKYQAEFVEENKYKINYTTGDTAGDESLNVTNLCFEYGENVEVSYDFTVEILKDELSINNFNVDTSSSQTKVTYNMTDDENSFVSGKIRAKKVNSEDVVEVAISSGVSEYTIELEEFELYNVELEITYDRDKNTSSNEHQETKVYATQENVQFVLNYDLEVSDFKLESVDKDVLFNANIKFNATNKSIYPIYEVIIEDKEYEVTLVDNEENTYLIEYPYGQDNLDKRKEIVVSSIVLENGAIIELEDKLSVVIFKDKPYAQIVELNSEDNSTIGLHFELTDSDNTVTELHAVLLDEKNEVVAEQSLDIDDTETTFVISQAGTYHVELRADYDRADGSTHSDEIISSDDKTVEIKPVARVTTENISDKYPDKLETIDITYMIESNTGKVPTKVVLNDMEEYTLEPVGENTNNYKISYNVSDNSQVKSLKVTKVYFGDDLPVETSNSVEDTIEILKTEPSINITSTDILEQNAVLFTITVNDPDEAMTSGKAKVHEQEQDLNRGTNTFLVNNINTDEEHILNVEVSYDLDFNTINEEQHEGKVTKDQKFTLVSNYGLSVSDVKTYNKSGNEETYFAKDEKFDLRFNSRNNTSLVPERVVVQDLNNESASGIEYPVNTIEEGGEHSYYVELSASNKAGKQEFKITSVILSGSRVIPESKFEGNNPSAKIEVLKDKPTMSNFTVNNQENSVTVDFDIKDEDKALKDSYVVLINKENNTQVQKYKVENGKNSQVFKDLIPGNIYIVKVENNYSLSEDGKVVNEIFKEQEIEITKKEESNFRVKNLTITKRVPIGSKVNISFENSLMSYEDVDKVVIDDQEYDVTKGEDGVYRLTLEPKETGVNKLHVDKVKIKDKEFEIDRNLSYVYEYAEPKAFSISEIEEDTTTNEAVITYQLEDKDHSVISLTAYMKNSAGSIVASKAIDLDTETIKTVKMDLRKISTYSIELRATCDIGDGQTYEEKTLFEVKKETVPRVTIVSQSIDKEYVEKKENVVLTFKINTNVDQEVKKISIGDESYKVTNVTENGKVVEDTYSITVQAPGETGVFAQRIESIQIGSNLIDQIIYPNGIEPINIKVFKQKPTVTHFIIDENSRKLSFRINDPDKSLTQSYPIFTINQGESEIYNEELKNGEAEYEFNLDNIGMTATQNEYNALVNVTYDLRPDVQAEKQSIMQKLFSLIAADDETQEEPEEEDPNAKYIVTENIFNENYKLVGNITYDLKFSAAGGAFTLWNYQQLNFDCSTGTNLKVKKVIIDGREYSVSPITKNNKDDQYFVQYKAFYVDQNSINFEKVILENGTALDIPANDGWAWCMVVQTNPTLSIKDFIEDVNDETVTVKYKLVDNDGKLAYDKLTFNLMNSQGGLIESKIVENASVNDTVVFNVPYPPTAVYKLQVTGKLTDIPDWYDYLTTWTPINDSFNSSVNTSILGAEIENKYPKQNETFAIDYSISSTKVIIIDKEDHTNQDKAVGITSLVINGKDYDVQALEDKPETYRIYYTAKDEPGLENIKVTYIKFSNGDVEAFNREDTVEVLKTEPYITDFKTENDLVNGKIKVSFDVKDPDGVISTNNIKAELDGVEKQVFVGSNSIYFDVTQDKLLDLKIKATYDLDENKLENETNTNYNSYTDNTIFERKLMLTGDYNVAFSNIKTFNTSDKETTFFEKNEDVKVMFDCITREPELCPEKIKISGEEYTLTKVPETESTYTVTIPGSADAQKISAKIDAVILNSGNTVPIENQAIEYEILKDHIKVTDFTYQVSNSNADKVELSITVEDKDTANKETRVEIIDEYSSKIVDQVLEIDTNNITFEKTEAEKYTVNVYSTYDRDSNNVDQENYYNAVKIHNQIVSLTTRYIEMKDIVDINLYTFDELGNAVKVDSLTEDNLNVVDNSLVEVSMKTIPTFYSKVTDYRVEGDKLKLVLDYTDAMVYTGEDELKPLEVTLDILENTKEYEYKGSFKALIEKMRSNNTSGAVIDLDKDYDLKDYPVSANQVAYIDFDYKGTINGHGHTISNLTIPLFKKLDGARVENLKIKNIVYTGGNRGVIANYATNSTVVSNVHVDNLVTSSNAVSGLIYEVSNKSVVEKCSATNLTYNANYLSQSMSGGFIYVKSEAKIENCYVQGKITSGWWNNAGFIVSADNNCKIDKNIVNMQMAAYYGFGEGGVGYGNGGIVANEGTKNSEGLQLTNNLSLVEGNKGVGAIYNYRNTKLNPTLSYNNYQLDTAVVKHEDVEGINTISKDELNADFFRNSLELDEDIWTISDDASIDNLPVLKGVSVAYSDQGKQPKNTEIYIPDYKRVSELPTYNESREIAYHNMYKLMPFYDAKELIRDGNKIPDGHELTYKIIDYIIPFNKDGKMVSNLTTNNYNSLDKIYIVFEDGTRLTYNIAFDDYYGNVASYMLPDLNIGYNYNNYIVDPNQDSVRRLIEVASKYDFKNDLDPVTEKVANDSRLYKEHFENYTKYHIEDFVINVLVNMGYSPNFDSDVLDDMIERELVSSGELKKLLFAYNYFTYWYNLDMDGINLADATMFHSNEMFDKDMTMEYLTDQLVQETNSATNGTAGFYNNYFVKYTKLSNLGYYLDYYVKTLTHYTQGIDWFKDHFKGGYYYDINVENSKGLYYTIWDHLLKDGKVQTNFLPLMTVPENSMYVMSSPSQAYFGSLRVYMTDPNDPKQIDAFKKKVEVWLKEVQSFYTFAYNYWGPDNINKYCDTNYDMRYTYTGVGNITVYNNPLTTEEPYHKYFAEAIGRWPATHGGAYANGNEVFWAVIKMLDNFRVGTHETLHNQDSKIFLNGYGRRGGAEDYAAGFIQQYYRNGWVSPNIFDEEEDLANPVFKDNVTQNLRKSSVENDEKLHAYYDKYFRVNDFLDWIEAKAYFELNDEQKASISVQVSYPEVSADKQDEGDDVVAYTPLTTDMVQGMKLTDMKALWQNRIMLRPGVKEYERRSPGADTDSIFNIHWYQPHADNDRPDGANFKYIAWQMAGEGGYYEGLVPYYTLSYIGIKNGTGEKTTDLIALRYITKDPTMTYERYKLERYEKLSEHFNDKGTYIDAETIYQEYLKALQTDANNKDRNLTQSTAVKKKYFQQIRRETNDFNIEPFEARADAATVSIEENEVAITNSKVVTNAEEFVNEITNNSNANIELGNDIDLSNYVDGEVIIDTEFCGIINGNGYNISGVNLPIFRTLNKATVKNVNIITSIIDVKEENVLGKTIASSTIKEVTVENPTVKSELDVGGLAINFLSKDMIIPKKIMIG